MDRLNLEVDESHVRALATSTLAGVSELVANACDADATTVDVRLERGDLDRIVAVVVTDDGTGIPRDEALRDFNLLGGSKKREAKKSAVFGRVLHGKHGRGRFRMFKLGGVACWRTTFQNGAVNETYDITIAGDRPSLATFTDAVTSHEKTGTSVRLSDFSSPPSDLEPKRAVPFLLTTFASYLTKYSVVLTYDGRLIDPDDAITRRDTVPLDGDFEGEASLEIIEWVKPPRSRHLLLADGSGIGLRELEVHCQTPGLKFTAMVTWPGFESVGELEAARVDYPGPGGLVVTAAEDAIKEHHRKWAADRRRDVVARWQRERVYPFEGEATDPVERAKRDTFDVVAVSAEQTINAHPTQAGQRLSLSLIREALEANPGRLHRVLDEVLKLPPERVDELAQLLDRTPLASIITAARTIANRLSFVHALERLTLDPDISPEVKERRQLHKILRDETWIFGDEFTIAVDDESLRRVLAQHISTLGREQVADPEPLDADGRRCIVDLMLARALPQARNRREHLVIELKAPRVTIGDEQYSQILRYANAVRRDIRFETVEVEWDFFIIGSKISETVEMQRSQPNLPYGQVLSGNLRVWVHTWAEILEAAKQRLKFVQKALEFSAQEEDAVAYLRTAHRDLVPAVAIQAPSGALAKMD